MRMRKLSICVLALCLASAAALIPQPLPAQIWNGRASAIRSGASNPATCSPSGLNVFYNTTSGLATCTAANTWGFLMQGGTFTGPILLPDGTAAAPAIARSASSNIGFFFGANSILVSNAGYGRIRFGNSATSAILLETSSCIGWTATGEVTAASGADTLLCRSATATPQWGANSATPAAQNLWFASARSGTDTNTAAALLSPRIRASMPTGTGALGYGSLSGGALGGTTGTAWPTEVDRLVWNYTKVLANNTATPIANFTLAANTGASVKVTYTIEVIDASNHVQNESGSVVCTVINSNGTFAQAGTNGCTKYGNHQVVTAVGGGTLAVTWTMTGANPAVLTLNSNTGTITPAAGYPRLTATFQPMSQQAVAFQ